MSAVVTEIFALVLVAATLAAAFAALTARSLLALCLCLAAVGALAAAVLLALGAGDAALTMAIVVAAWAPVLLIGAVLLSARSAKSFGAGAPWLSMLAAALAGGAIAFAAPDVGPALARAQAAPDAIGFWLAPLLLVVGVGCYGVLGFGERGALDRRAEPEL